MITTPSATKTVASSQLSRTHTTSTARRPSTSVTTSSFCRVRVSQSPGASVPRRESACRQARLARRASSAIRPSLSRRARRTESFLVPSSPATSHSQHRRREGTSPRWREASQISSHTAPLPRRLECLFTSHSIPSQQPPCPPPAVVLSSKVVHRECSHFFSLLLLRILLTAFFILPPSSPEPSFTATALPSAGRDTL